MSNFTTLNTEELEQNIIQSDITTIKSQLAGTTVQNGLNVKHPSGSITCNINCKEDQSVKLELGSYDGAASSSTLELATNNGGGQSGAELVFTNSNGKFSINRINSGTAVEVLSFIKTSNNITCSGVLTDSNGGTITTAEKAKLAYITISNDANLSTMETATTDNATAIALRTIKGLNRCLEKISAICDGRKMYPDYLKSAGTKFLTTANVNSAQTGTHGQWIDVNGSTIVYKPPTLGAFDSATRGTVIYKFSCVIGKVDGAALMTFQLVIDGTEVEAKCNQVIGSSGFYGSHVNFELPIQIDSGLGNSAATAVFTNWNSTKTLKLQVWEYANSTEFQLFKPHYFESGYQDNASMPVVKPMISIETYGYG